MDDKEIFLKGGFSMGWCENDNSEPTSALVNSQPKDLETLQKELQDIKDHIQDIQQRKWEIDKKFSYLVNDFQSE